MIPLEEVSEKVGVGGQESGKEMSLLAPRESVLSRSERRQCLGEAYPPGVEREGVGFNTDPVFHPEGGVETGGESFNSPERKAESGLIVREEQPRTLVEEVVPGLPGAAPLVRRRGMKVLTEKLIEDFCLLLSLGLSRRQVAARLDIDHSTISHAAGKDEEFAALLRRAEEMAASEPMLCLIAASRKNWRAALTMITFKRQFPQPPDREEKERRMKEKLDDTRREMEYEQQVDFLKEQASEQEERRQQAKRDAEEEAWQQRERAMLQKEREEREPRRKR